MAGRESGGKPAEPTLRESKSALLEAAQAAIAEQRTRRPLGPVWSRGGRARTAFRSTITGLILAGAVILLVRPAWLTGPRLAPEPPEIRAASATLALIDAASRVRAYQGATGRLPARLKDAGVTDETIGYQKIGPTDFVIRLVAGDSTVTLRSTDSIKPKLLQAVRALQRRG